MKTKFEKLVIDESISPTQLNACLKWLEDQDIIYQQIYRIALHHPGIPDSLIFKTVLNEQDALLTSDRPFHNRLLAEDRTSFYIDETLAISRLMLQGIRAAFLPLPRGDEEKQAKASILHKLVMPDSDKALKRLRTKRRRIRNHFGGYDQLNQLGLTVATQQELLGIHLHVAGSSAKGIMASERYILESNCEIGKAALCHALILVLQLMLQRLNISIYYDPANIQDPYILDDQFFMRLKTELPTLNFIACSKGRRMDSLRQKLRALKSNNNEIIPGYLSLIEQKVNQFPPGIPVANKT